MLLEKSHNPSMKLKLPLELKHKESYIRRIRRAVSL
jgi:hypothetical protein